jgi:hypothetical protein
MIKGHGQTAGHRRGLAAAAVLLLIFTCGGFPEPATATRDDRILHLTPDKDRCFLGPYSAYLPDPQKKLTIETVSSPQMSARFVRHAGKMLNLGFNTSAYWIRFTVDISDNKTSQKKWLLYFGWPNNIDYATLYIPEYSGTGFFAKELGRILPSGRDPRPSSPTAFLPSENFIEPLTFDFQNFNPHLHVLATDGCFYNDDAFMVCPPSNTGDLEELLRHEVFTMLKAEGNITDVVIENMMHWRHSV